MADWQTLSDRINHVAPSATLAVDSKAKAMKAAGNDVILENGFWSREERDSYRAVAQSLGCETRLHYLDVPVEELQRRIIARNRDAPADAAVDPNDLLAWSKMFEPPTTDELAVGHGTAPP